MILGDPNRPFPQRSDTMSLDIIHAQDVPRGPVKYIKECSNSLKTDDIGRCQPFYPWKSYLNKPHFQLRSDVPGCTSAPLHPNVTRVKDLSLTTADIEWAQPKITRFNTNRCIDPLQPQYQLPSCPARPPTPPRGNGQDSLDISDIEQSRPKRVVPDRNYVRDPNDASDIEYTVPNYRRRIVRPIQQDAYSTSLEVADINAFPGRTSRPRGTNPLDPTYHVSQVAATSLPIKWSEEEGRVWQADPTVEVIGEVPQSKPRKLQWDNGEPFFNLLTEDIAGSRPQRWVGAVPFNIYDPPEKKPIISFHEPQDVPGTQVGSLRKGIVTMRNTNPLHPRYTMLDGPAAMHPLAERGDPSASVNLATTLPADYQATLPRANSMPPGHAQRLSDAGSARGSTTSARQVLEAARVKSPLSQAGSQTMRSQNGSQTMRSQASHRSSRSGRSHGSAAHRLDSFIQ